MDSAKHLNMSLSLHVKPSKIECTKSNDEKDFMSKIPYLSVVGSLMYPMVATTPKTIFIVGIVSIFLSVRNTRK